MERGDSTHWRLVVMVCLVGTCAVSDSARPSHDESNHHKQKCGGPLSKEYTFPNLDYALLGYNILRGYPLAAGRDPGMTYPIFKADYSPMGHTADCRHRLPTGYFIIPDVSCSTSFTSKEVKDRQDLSDLLSMHARIPGGGEDRGEGVHFIANSAYQEVSENLAHGDDVYIISTAFCRNYHSVIKRRHPPPQDNDFLAWAKQIVNASSSSPQLLEFIDYYGTHFLEETEFGAKLMYVNKLPKRKAWDDHRNIYGLQLNSRSRDPIHLRSRFSVEAHATYFALRSVGAESGLDSDQKVAASSFYKLVESKTAAVGPAPPGSADAVIWASSVKMSPMPVKYKLTPIHQLFTSTFMKEADFDYESVGRELYRAIEGGVYCETLHSQGLVDSCEQPIVLPSTASDSGPGSSNVSRDSCFKQCYNNDSCLATTYCGQDDETSCQLHSEASVSYHFANLCTLMVAPVKMVRLGLSGFRALGAKIAGERLGASRHVKDEAACKERCETNRSCSVFVFWPRNTTCSGYEGENCLLYSRQGMRSIAFGVPTNGILTGVIAKNAY